MMIKSHTEATKKPVYFMNLFLGVLTTFTAIMALIVVFFLYGPVVETNYFPVTTEIVAKVTEFPNSAPNKSYFSVTGEKVRACDFIHTEVLAKVNKLWTPGDAVFFNRDFSERSAKSGGVGRQNFGVWGLSPVSDGYKVVAVHKCHPFWNTRTVLFEKGSK